MLVGSECCHMQMRGMKNYNCQDDNLSPKMVQSGGAELFGTFRLLVATRVAMNVK